ncbi:TetR/AcrR family transcriptional regulator [Corynebacterium caspium]|uniref:TetR/AcrR family transcriptional regulator n=1 Tax=Corynebacterium caspium TaxID=234828 RepID=UPI00037691DE|nr:TetR/AcrR family transcriptional regulator [Corynebacterium caspium]WKD58667.1 HTH-type transcriptional regulator AcrR [Corynebacterium caspium DSM 44850]
MPYISDERREAQRQRIVNAAIKMIAQKGISAVSISDIISASGLSTGAVYSYFKGKKEILIAATEFLIPDNPEILHTATETIPTPAPEDIFLEYLGFNEDEGEIGAAVLQLWSFVAADKEAQMIMNEVINEIYENGKAYMVAWYKSNGHDEASAIARADQMTWPIIGYLQGAYGINSIVQGSMKSFLQGLRQITAP